MKCIKNIDTKKVSRVKDQDAHEKVSGGQYKYIDKDEYKRRV